MVDPQSLHSLRTRILTVFLGVILIILISITVIFNVLVNRYVSSTATAQLSAVVAGHTTAGGPQDGTSVEIPDVSGAVPSVLNIRPAVFLLDSNYVATTPVNASSADQQTAQTIAALLKARDFPLAAIDNFRVSSDVGSYYISCRPVGTSTHYLVFYVDLTGIVNFAGSVNLLLIVIMLAAVVAAVVATVLITRRLTRPLADLTKFSRRIGSGDFTACTEEFHDREFATLAESMNHAARQLESYDKDQKTFFQNASHELRTPLMSITCYAEGIACGLMDPGEASQTILNETTRLSGMVEDLLSISRIDSITNEQKTVMCNLTEIVETAVEEQRWVAEERGLNLVVTLPGTPLVMAGNDKTLHRAFSNLMSNAVRYAVSRIAVTLERQGPDAVITVADDGPGVDPQDLPHIFERFYMGANGHHGIGLAIVKSVVDQHGGAIQVRSDAAGACFRLSLPVPDQPGGGDDRI